MESMRKTPPPVPPRLFSTPNKVFPPKTTNVVVKSNEPKIANTKDVLNIDQPDDDIGDSDDLVIFDKKLLSIDSNQSSTDSNRSQTTIDTGYISSFENDRSSLAPRHTKRQFRGRFSSEDTQSSEDTSFYSSDLQRADTVDSLQTNFTDSPFSLRKNTNIFNFDRLNQKMSSCGSIDSDNSKRKPPTPPVRYNIKKPPSRTFLDSGKLLQNSQGLGTFNSPSNNQNESTTTITTTANTNNSVPSHHRRPPPLTQIHNSKMNQRQDSNLSSDSFSLMSSPGYNSKNMEVPLIQHSSKISKQRLLQQNSNMRNVSAKLGNRQDSNSDSFSQTSSPGYNSKLIEAPLLANAVKLHALKQSYKTPEDIIKEQNNDLGPSLRQSASTPAMQTFVRFSNGSNMSFQHKIMRARKNSNPYITRGRLKFRLCQILCNALALLLIAAGLAAYFKAYPTLKFVNQTVIRSLPDTTAITNVESNPAPGICLPIIVKFCKNHKLPYNYTVFPNYIGHFGQLEAQVDLENFDALVDVNCYELVPLFLCSLFVPKCNSNGKPLPPCKNLCMETMKRCGFFFDVFGLELPDYLNCRLFSDSTNADECVGGKEVRELKTRKPICHEFKCDEKRCIPANWVCDGHVDCQDQTDELDCDPCKNATSNSTVLYCGKNRCMENKHICDGIEHCPFGQDERNCIRLSERNGDLGRGTLEIYKADKKQWRPACIKNWEDIQSPAKVCSMLGYSSVNSSVVRTRNSNITLTGNRDPSSLWRSSQRRNRNLLREYASCSEKGNNHPVVELTCSNFECGKVRKWKSLQTRIIGGKQSFPGDWPFLAAILGGPDEIFYCAGVLISDQWVLTASHCVGNHTTTRNLNDWTIQLGMTRRHSHTHYGQKVKVKSVIPHPQYNFYSAHDNDLALFQLATRVAFHEHLLPVCLPPVEMKELEPGTMCIVIGWGKKEDKNSNPNARNTAYEPAINEVQVPILNRDLCNEWLESLNVTSGMICAGYQDGGKDACQGDSGGPLLCPMKDDKNRYFVGGIVSWGIMCAHPKLPGVYANVPKYIPWIMQQMQSKSSSNSKDSNLGIGR